MRLKTVIVLFLIMSILLLLGIYILLRSTNVVDSKRYTFLFENDDTSNPADHQHAYLLDTDDTSNIPGLYTNEDKVKVLDIKNFKENVDNSSKAWLVQFYNSWCGHCINFSPVWKSFAEDVYNWRDLVVIAAINCADDKNSQLCREYEIMGYPSVRFFPPHLKFLTLGTEFSRSVYFTKMRHNLAQMLASVTHPTPDWPILTPVEGSTLGELWTNLNTTKDFAIIVSESSDSIFGLELILDVHELKHIEIRRSIDPGIATYLKRSSPSIYVLYKNLSAEPIPVHFQDRSSFFDAVSAYLGLKGIGIKGYVQTTSSTLSTPRAVFDPNVRDQLISKVYLADLETALRYSLYHEIPLRRRIQNESFNALVDYLEVLDKFFPKAEGVSSFLHDLNLQVSNESEITGENFRTLVQHLETKHSPVWHTPNEFHGCRGSNPKYRGYPCSLWMLAHTLTVHARDIDATKVLKSFAAYIKNFFGCNECSKHFLRVARTIDSNVTTLDDAVIWLWRAHNMANERLSKDASEDPEFPKTQFPPETICPDCRNSDGSWNESKVLKFLRSMYSNITDVSVKNVTSAGMLMSEPRAEFGFSDIDICIVLYIGCFMVLFIYVIKVTVFRRPHRTYIKRDNPLRLV